MNNNRFCTLYSGSSGNSTLVSNGNTNILVDAGVSCAKICTSLKEIGFDPEEIDGIVLTHEHVDHIRGVDVLSRKYHIPVYASEGTFSKMNLSGIDDKYIRCVKSGESFEIRDMGIYPFKIPHDAAQPLGYTMCVGDKRFSVATDIGHLSESLVKSLCKSDAVLLESNHDIKMLTDGAYPFYLKKRILGDFGHLPNDKAAWMATQLAKWGTTRIILGHLSKENNLPSLAFETSKNMLESNGIKVGSDVILKVADRSNICEI